VALVRGIAGSQTDFNNLHTHSPNPVYSYE